MPKKKSLWLESKKTSGSIGKWLASWLNDPDFDRKFVEELLVDAQIVHRWLAEYPTLHRLNVARREKKLPTQFWKSHEALNEKLANLVFAPQIDLHELPDGERVSWTLITTGSPIVAPSMQIRWVVRLIEEGIILKIRRCKHCNVWFFAQFSH